MNTTIIYTMKPENTIFELPKSNRIFYKTDSLKKAYIYHIEHINVDSYIIDPLGMTEEQLHSMVEHIRYLNAIITIVLYKPPMNFQLERFVGKNLKMVNSESEISQCLTEISKVQRDSNRVQWPLQVEFWQQENKAKTLKKAKVLSLSASGCFVKTDAALSLKKGDKLALLFSFNEFDFFSDGSLVRLSTNPDETMGIAIEFKEVSRQTQKCIGEIIDEKILSQIMEAIK